VSDYLGEYQFLILASVFTLLMCFPTSTGEYCIFENLYNCRVCICICGFVFESVFYVFGLVGMFVVIIMIYMYIFETNGGASIWNNYGAGCRYSG